MEMNLNFIVGFIVNQMMQSLRPTPHSHIDSSMKRVVDYVVIPVAWIGERKMCPQFVTDCNQIVDEATLICSNLLMGYEFRLEWRPYLNDMNFIQFNYYIKKKEKPVKKMTVEEIEKALGYKVEVVSKESK